MKKILLFALFGFTGFTSLQAQQSKQAINAMSAANPAFTNTQLYSYHTYQPVSGTQAISGYYTQGFESLTFPPAGCQVVNVAGPAYAWARSTAQAHLSTASAFMRYDAVSGGGQDWLIMPHYSVTASTDSIVFWMRLVFQGYSPDSLSIKVSTTDSLPASFTTTLLHLREGTNYPPNSTTWYRYAISLNAYVGQNIYLAFKHYNVDGDGVYVDDVAIGTKPAAEVMPTALISPVNNIGASIISPQASFYNSGSATQTFSVTANITPGGYTSTSTITALAPNTSANATFAPWTSSAGTYTLKIYSQLSGDANLLNDTLTRTITILPLFQEYGWESMPALPTGRWATSPVFVKPCLNATDTGFVYLISGGDATFANSTLNTRFNTVTGVYTNMAPIPQSRTQITPLHVNGKIYVIGGYGGSFAPVTTNSIYDIVTNTWSTGAPMPTAVGDYAAGSYSDSLLYFIGGYNGTTDVNLVQIYNVNTNTWTTGTAKTGTAVGGGRMGISGNKIVFTGGYSQTLAATISDALLGIINPTTPDVITWTSLPAFPGGTTGRFGAGAAFENNGLVYMGAGDPNGQGTTVLSTMFAYNTILNQWEIGPNIPVGLSNISGFAAGVYNDSLYMITMGGYNGTAVLTSNSWLNIGPAAPLPSAAADMAVCVNNTSVVLNAYNGTAYAWSPAATLNDSTLAAPAATPASTTTYTVLISKAYGCKVTDSLKVTVNALPTVVANTSAAIICDGDSVILSGDGALSFTWTGGVTDSVFYTPIATDTYTVTGTDANGCENTANVTVTLNTLPAVIANASFTTICEGDSVILSGDGALTFTWTGGVTDSVFYTPAATGTYTVTGTDVNGCENTANITVTVNTLPAVTLTLSPASICINDAAVTLSGASPAGGSYTGIGVTAGSFDPAVAGAGAITIVYSYTDANFCVATATDSILVDACVGLRDVNGSNLISLYPNPATNQFTVQLSAVPATPVKGEVLNALGQVIMHFSVATTSQLVDISNLESGLYFVRMISGNTSSLQQLIKK